MPIDPASLGATSDPKLVAWSDTETLLYALAVGAGVEDLALTTENSHGVPQQVLPTFAVVVAAGFDVLPRLGRVSYSRMLHGAQGVRLHRPLPAAGELEVVAEIADLQDKGETRNAVVTLVGRGNDPRSGELVAETTTTLVFRGHGGFGGSAGASVAPVAIPERVPDHEVDDRTDERQPLLYRLTGDRNPLHSDPWFAREKAGFPRPILHGLCTYGIAGRALVAALCDGDCAGVAGIDARFTAPVFPGERLTTSAWQLTETSAAFRVEAHGTDDLPRRVVLDAGHVALRT